MLITRAAIGSTAPNDRDLRRERVNLVDVRVQAGVIAAVAPALAPQAGEDIVDAGGCALMPGLHDHHMHLLALASALQSLDCNGDHDSLAQRLRARADEKPAEIRGFGYHPGAHEPIDRSWLDRLCPDIPVRIQHQSGRLWILNSAAIRQIRAGTGEWPGGAERDQRGEPNGRFYHADDWLRTHLPRPQPALGAVSRQLAACGVTGLTDAGPDNDDSVAAILRNAQARGELLQNVLLMGRAELSECNAPMLQRGAQKMYLKENALPEFDWLCDEIRRSHDSQRPVAFHCVTRVELQFALAALHDAGVLAGDRIEHASVTSDDALPQLRALGITVVTQPHFIAERGDRYRAQVDADDVPLLYRARALLDAGVPLAAGTDAPYGHYDPWRSMRAATERRCRSGVVMGRDECLSPQQALALYLGDSRDPGRTQRQLTPGQAADLCLLDCDWPTLLAELRCEHVCRVWRAGELIFAR